MIILAQMTPAEFCESTASIWGIIGWLVMILKIVIPLLLIIFGMLDLGKAVIASDDKAINKAVTTLLHRFIAGVIVFFVPTLVIALFNAFTGINASSTGSYGKCVRCVLDVNTESAKRVEDAKGNLVQGSDIGCKSANLIGDN